MANGGSVLRELDGRELQPLGECPDMIGEARRHRWSPVLPGWIRQPGAERPYRPTRVVAIKGEVRRRLLRLPALREAEGFPPFAGVVVPVGQVLPLQERDANPPAFKSSARFKRNKSLQMGSFGANDLGSHAAFED